MKRVLSAAWLMGLAGLAGAGLAAADPTAPSPSVSVGDRWVWQHSNGLANEKDFTQIESVVQVSDSEIRTQVKVKGKPGSAIATYTHEWNPVDVVAAKFDPYLKDFDFPLQVGKSWKGSADKVLFANGKHGNFYLKGEVVAFEKVTVPGGTFDAYRVAVSLDATGTDEDANIGHTVETYWYAPAVNRHVKLVNEFSRDGRVRSKDVYEMVEYSLR